VAESLRPELAAGEKLRVISGEDVARMKRELHLLEADGLSKETLAKIWSNLNAEVVLLGSYLSLGTEAGGQIRLNLILQDTKTGETISSVSETGTEPTVPLMVSQAGALLRAKLGLEELATSDVMTLKTALPRSLGAQRKYSAGLDKLRSAESVAARDLLQQAVEAEPNFALGHSALANAWAAIGYEGKAREEARIAFTLSANLAPEQAMAIEAKYRELARDWDRAIEIYQKLCEFSPDDAEYRLLLAAAQTQAGKANDALATLKRLRTQSGPFSENPRTDLAEASIAEAQGNFKREQLLAEQAARRAELRGARLLVADARLRECWAFYNLGQPKPAIEVAEQARKLFAAIGDRGGEARSLKNIADVEDDDGHHAEAQAMYERALAIFREIANETGVAVTLNNLGYAIEVQGSLDRAKKVFDESLAVCQQIDDRGCEAQALNGVAIVLWRQGNLDSARETFEEALRMHLHRDDKSRAAIVLGNIAIILQDQGFLAEAKARFDQTLAMFVKLGDKRGQARTLGNLGELLIKRGNLPEAKKNFEEQLALGQAMPEDRQRAYALHGLGEVFLAQGDLQTAKEKHDEALVLRTKMAEKGLIAESRMALAELALEEGNPEAAASAAREASEEFHTEREIDQEASARAILAEALAAARRAAPALAAMTLSKEEAVKSEDQALRIEVLIANGKVCAAVDQTAEAIRSFRSALAEASNHGYEGYALTARLGLGRAEFESGNPDARSRLEALEREARAKGFGLIAAQAASVLSSKPRFPKVARSRSCLLHTVVQNGQHRTIWQQLDLAHSGS